MRSKRLWLCVAPVVLCVLDNALTLAGQPARYWAGDYASREEFNPVMAWALERHPLVLAAQTTAWILLFCALIVVLPLRLAKVLALALSFGNATGAGHWMTWKFDLYWLYPIHFLASAALVVWTWEKAGAEQRTP
jgi:hypothetical protein